MFIMIGAIINALAASIVLYVSIRNFRIHAENLKVLDKMEEIVRDMVALRDLLERTDPLTAGDASKEGRSNGIH